MVSGYFLRDEAEIRKALDEGLIYRFISKPFRHDEILAAVRLASSPADSRGSQILPAYLAEAASNLDSLSSIRASGSAI